MTESDNNPYSPPCDSEVRLDPVVAVRGPAISLIVVSLIGLLSILMTLLFNILFFIVYWNEGVQSAAPDTAIFIVSRMVWSVLILATNVVILVGAIKMLGLRNYDICRLGATLAVIPCIGPCYFLGIPFGIWALIVLNRSEVQRAFQDS